MYLAGFPGDAAPPAVFLFLVVRPKMLCIMAGVTQKDLCLEEYLKIVFFWEICHMFPYSALLGATVDTYACQSTEAFGFSRSREGGPRIPRSILPCPGGSRTNFTHSHYEGGHAPEFDSRPVRSVGTRSCVSLRSILEGFSIFSR